ncbi:hypothetical protein [Phenylobacterium sp.]|uniref:hypothetical protein n=1 Tax=Phenylobacterium sp. TaxID=1871053 RepID=UPI00273027FF|nr:hypothetical protein [Phenylobacterium sp.]MDP1874830.1 hypothetical protein [Phenylobacterium sp.]
MDGSDSDQRTTSSHLAAGTLLVWEVDTQRAASMAATVATMVLGSSSINPIGLRGQSCYFDVILEREESELAITLALGAQPRRY